MGLIFKTVFTLSLFNLGTLGVKFTILKGLFHCRSALLCKFVIL